MLRTALRACGLALLCSLTACGASDDDKAAEALSKSLIQENDEVFKVSQEDADCVGQGFVDEIGTDKLKEYGILTEDLEASDETLSTKMSKEDAEAAAAVFVDCTDAVELFSAAMFAGEDISDETQACIDAELTEDVIEQFFVATFAQDESLVGDAMAPLQECVTGAGG